MTTHGRVTQEVPPAEPDEKGIPLGGGHARHQRSIVLREHSVRHRRRETPGPPPRSALLIATLGIIALGMPCLSCASLGFGGRGDAGAPTPRVFYPDLPDQPRLQFLATYTAESDVTGGPGALARFLLGEVEDPEITKPYGMAVHDHKIFVCDSKRGAVVVLDLAARSVGMLGARPPGRLLKPINIAIDADGRRYVTDMRLRRVLVYDDANQYVTAFGDPETWSPSDVAIRGDSLYVTDVKQGQVLVLDKESGEEQMRIARRGSSEGELFLPTSIEVDGEGRIYVADTGNFRVVQFGPRGDFVRQIGSLGRNPGHFARPKGIAVDREGRLYVADAAFENLQIFDSEGRVLLAFGSAGNMPGGLNLPAQVEIDYDHVDLFADRVAPGYSLEYVVLVSSQYGRNKVNVYGFLKPVTRQKRQRASLPSAD